MISIGRLSLAAGMALVSQACFHHTPVKAVTIDEPGVHVVSGMNGTSIVWYDGKQNRACTLPGGGKGGKGGRGKWAAMHPEPEAPPHGNMLDSALFRLCEARGNGDISAGQYSAAIDAVTKAFERGHGGAQRFEKKIKFFHGDPGEGGGCPHCTGDSPGEGCSHGDCPHGAGPDGGCPHCAGGHGAGHPMPGHPPGAGMGPKAGPPPKPPLPAKPAGPPKPPAGPAKPPAGPPKPPQ